ncbi:MAG: hypothetical protein GXP55_22310 [Deltaproteobacteria bacterium]|nr:hypothetical protein [Deltaproteobacteria bacterium]
MKGRARHALPAGQERAVEAAFEVAPSSSGGYRVERIRIEESRVRAIYRGPGGDEITLVARHPEDAPGCPRRTERFTLEGDLPAELMQAVESAVRAGERAIRWKLMPDVQGDAGDEPGSDARDAELLAFRAGLKPALRRTMPTRDAARALARELEDAGFGVCISQQEQRLGGQLWSIVYAADSTVEAEGLRHLDLLQAMVPVATTETNNRTLGLALGYPSCCVEAFIQRDRVAHSAQRRRLGLAPHYRYLAAREAWSERSRWELNPHLAGEGVSLVSFEPCGYACPDALGIARRTLAVVAEEDAAAARSMEGRLRCTIAITRRGDIVGLRFVDDARSHEVRALRTAFDLPPSVAAEKAARSMGRRPRAPSKPARWDWWSPVVVDFDHESSSRPARSSTT